MNKLVSLTETEEKALKKVKEGRDVTEARFPLISGLIGTFGLVTVLYGFEKLIDRSEWLSSNPWVLIAVGLGILLVTGAAYKKLN